MFPVNAKRVPDYYNIITRPMDLQQVRKNIGDNKYELRRQFLEDLSLMLMNSHTYNGPASIITIAAKDILDLASTKLNARTCQSAAFTLEWMAGKSCNLRAHCKTHGFGTIEQNIKEHNYTSVSAFQETLTANLAELERNIQRAILVGADDTAPAWLVEWTLAGMHWQQPSSRATGGDAAPEEAEDEEFESESDPGVLLDDLALSNDDEQESPEDGSMKPSLACCTANAYHRTTECRSSSEYSDADEDEE
uniref:Bromo domain-containing protein n=1 Tax=Ditylenchus dipsaci TaxID=166011 RepID=A0A915DZF5_9BILA